MPQLRGIVWPPITTTCILIVSSPRPHKHAVCCLYFSHRLPARPQSKWHIYIQIISDRRVLPGRLSQTYLTRLMLWLSNASDSQHAWQQACHVEQGIKPQSFFFIYTDWNVSLAWSQVPKAKITLLIFYTFHEERGRGAVYRWYPDAITSQFLLRMNKRIHHWNKLTLSFVD